MTAFDVRVTIENKPGMNDPEGETILRDLVLRNEYSSVSSIKTARVLRFSIDASTSQEACKLVRKMCEELRVYNPIVSRVSIESVS